MEDRDITGTLALFEALTDNVHKRLDAYEKAIDKRLSSFEVMLKNSHCTQTDKFVKIDASMVEIDKDIKEVRERMSAQENWKSGLGWKGLAAILGFIVVVASIGISYGRIENSVGESRERIRSLETSVKAIEKDVVSIFGRSSEKTR